jgi:hypothetical protein
MRFLRGLLIVVLLAFQGALTAIAQGGGRFDERHLTITGITIGESSLEDVRFKFGPSENRRCPNREGQPDWICYSINDPNARLIFRSGPLGGWHTVDGYRIVIESAGPSCFRDCPRVKPGSLAVVETGGGLRLGLGREQVQKLLGSADRRTTSELRYSYESRRRMTEAEIQSTEKTFGSKVEDPFFDVLDTITIRLRRNRVVDIAVQRTVSR